MLNGCKKTDYHALDAQNNLQTMNGNIQYQDGTMTILGDTIPNAFTISNMEAARQALDSLGITSKNPVNVRTTHYYVKFYPSNFDQLDALYLSDTNVIFWDVPILRQVTVQGSWYKEDPNAPDSIPTPHYASVPVDYNFPVGISYDILSELYLPDMDPELIGNDPLDNIGYIETMVYTAGRIAGTPPLAHELFNPFGINYDTVGFGHLEPSGRIQIYDTRLASNIGLEGAKISCTRLFSGTRNGTTDANGDYTLNGSFISGAKKYTVWFQRDGFNVADNYFNHGKVQRSGITSHSWSHTITLGYENMQGHMFRAAYRYFYGDAAGLKRPKRGFMTQRLVAKYNSGTLLGIYHDPVNYVAVPIIEIPQFKAGTTTAYNSDDYYTATIHELAHSSHALSMNSLADFLNVNKQIRESWALAVEWLLTSMEYKSRGISNYGEYNYNPSTPPMYPNHYAYQYWNLSLDPNYTSLFINLVDGFNEFGQTFGWESGTVNDQVSGYSLGHIQSTFLKHCYAKSSLTTQLKANKPSGVTDAQIDLLLSHY